MTMRNLFILLCLAVMTACAQRQCNETAQTVVTHELDSMCMCINEFDATFDLGDTVAETDDGVDALNAWDAMLKQDTIDVAYARGLFSTIAHEMLFVLDAQLDCDPDDQTTVEFDNQWRKFLLYWTDTKE